MTQDDQQDNAAKRIEAVRQLHKAAFRPTKDGYIYRAPKPYLVGRTKHYLVGEAQREAILDVLSSLSMTQAGRALGFGVIGFFLLALPAALLVILSDRIDTPTGATVDVLLLTGAALLLAIALAVIVGVHVFPKHQLAALQPILTAATLTKQRVTIGDMQWSLQTSTQTKAVKRGLMVGGAINLVAATAFLVASYMKWPAHGGFGVALPIFNATIGVLLLARACAVIARAKAKFTGIGSRAFDRNLARATIAAFGLFILATLVQIILLTSGALKPDGRATRAPVRIVASNNGVASTSMAPGDSRTLSAGESVKVPAGTSVRTVQGSRVNLNGHNSTVRTPPGTYVGVPADATGPADNTVIAK